MVKICHISTAHNKLDDRIFYKECVSLSTDFDVNFVVQSDCNERIRDVNIIGLPIFKSRLKRMLVNPIFAFFKVMRLNPKVIHFHDPELIFAGILFKLFGKKVIYDMHELVYCQINDKDWIKNQTIKKLVSFSYKMIEKLAMRLFDRIILAENGYSKYFDENYKKQLHKVIYIRNFPVLKLINNQKTIVNRDMTKIVLLYAGGLTKIRGIKEIVDSLIYVKQHSELWLLGKFDDEEYQNACQSSTGWKNVKYFGYLKHEDVYQYTLSCDIGISLLYPLPNYMTSLPVKAFEYMACEKPMIMSDFPYWKDIFGDVALFCNPMDPKEIATCINELMLDKDHANLMAKEGRKLILEKFSWEAESQRLIEIYNQLLSKKR